VTAIPASITWAIPANDYVNASRIIALDVARGSLKWRLSAASALSVCVPGATEPAHSSADSKTAKKARRFAQFAKASQSDVGHVRGKMPVSLYQTLASAKDELRRAKDHEQTIRAIAEYVELAGKNADDRKRELAFALFQDALYRKAQADLRDAEAAVDQAQSAIDQAEADRRDREWAIRMRLAEALPAGRNVPQPVADDELEPF
jgi:multidrug efflux pump subunit AcrA (membrane-fusion protein)